MPATQREKRLKEGEREAQKVLQYDSRGGKAELEPNKTACGALTPLLVSFHLHLSFICVKLKLATELITLYDQSSILS